MPSPNPQANLLGGTSTNTVVVNNFIHEDYDVVNTSEDPIFLSIIPGAGKPASIVIFLDDNQLPPTSDPIVQSNIGLGKDLVNKTLDCTITCQAIAGTNDQAIVTITLEGGKKVYSCTLQQPIKDGLAIFNAIFDLI